MFVHCISTRRSWTVPFQEKFRIFFDSLKSHCASFTKAPDNIEGVGSNRSVVQRYLHVKRVDSFQEIPHRENSGFRLVECLCTLPGMLATYILNCLSATYRIQVISIRLPTKASLGSFNSAALCVKQSNGAI